MADDENAGVPTSFQVEILPENEAGRFADFANIWHTDSVFVLDFAALRAPAVEQVDSEGNPSRVVSARVVSRIRIPPQQVFELAKALTRELEAWESQNGIRPPDTSLFGQS